jgi:hypothetical protein
MSRSYIFSPLVAYKAVAGQEMLKIFSIGSYIMPTLTSVKISTTRVITVVKEPE